MDLDIGGKFDLKETSSSNIPFKLLSTFPTWNLAKSRSFIAVSYCWHGEEWEFPPNLWGRSNRQWPRFPISLKMLSGILRLRNAPEEALWIDQLCISQNDADEKARAVKRMDVIYKSARLVSIVLEGHRTSRCIEDILIRLSSSQPDDGYLYVDPEDPI
jgi:hypothetical protein